MIKTQIFDIGEQFHIISYKLMGHSRVFLWNAKGIITDGGQRIRFFDNPTQLTDYTQRNNITVDADPWVKVDLDAIAEWCQLPTNGFDGKTYLDAWNMFSDVAKATGKTFKGDEDVAMRKVVYDKMFLTANVKVQEATGVIMPVWSTDELQYIRLVMLSGIQLMP